MIREELLSRNNVKDAVVLTLGDSCAVGIRTQNLFCNSDAEQLTAEICADLKRRYGFRNVFVFKGVKELYVMKKIRTRLDSGENPSQIYDELRSIFYQGQNAKNTKTPA